MNIKSHRCSLVTAILIYVLLGPERAMSQILWEPPDDGIPSDAIYVPGSAADEGLAVIELAHMKLVLERTTLSEILARLGGTLGHSGQDGLLRTWLCYYQAHSPDSWIVWLQSDELHGESVLRAVEIGRMTPDIRLDNRCQALPTDGDIVLPANLRLGQQRADVFANLGEPIVSTPNMLLFGHARTIQLNGVWTVVNTVKVGLDNTGTVKDIGIWKTTTD